MLQSDYYTRDYLSTAYIVSTLLKHSDYQ